MAAGGSSRGPDGLTQDEHKNMVESTNMFRESVVRIIKVKDQDVVGSGNAFRVYNGDNKSLFLTCAHNFDEEDDVEYFGQKKKKDDVEYFIRLYPEDKHNYSVELKDVLWRSDEEHDLLLFSVKSVPKRKCLALSTAPVKYGDRVVVLAYVSPTLLIDSKVQELLLVKDPTPLTGVVIAPPFKASKTFEKIWITCEATPGVSGSPVMFINGNVIAVFLGSDKGWRDSVSVNTVFQLLCKWLGKNNNSTFEELFKLAHDKE